MADIIRGILLLSLLSASQAVLPFGAEYGDMYRSSSNEGKIDQPFHFIVNGNHYQNIEVQSAGHILLRDGTDRLRVFPHPEGRISVSTKAMHNDSEFTATDVYARVTNDSYVQKSVASIVKRRFLVDFVPERVLVATWTDRKRCQCPHNSQAVRSLSTQCVVATDGFLTYALYFDSGCTCRDSSAESTPTTTSTGYDNATREYHDGLSSIVQLNPRSSALHADENKTTNFVQFRLDRDPDNCLALSPTQGYVTACEDEAGSATSGTVFRIHGSPGSQQIDLFGSGQCLDREHCHSSTSNLRHSDCDHCGAIHWSLTDGTLLEDQGKNCVVAGTTIASVHHSSGGCTRFEPRIIGDRIQFQSIDTGDCLQGMIFIKCEFALQFTVDGLPGQYQLRDVASGSCLDREHCHSATSNIRIYDCTHCGAIHWSMVDSKLGEDGMANCVNRGPADSAVMRHCSDGWEHLRFNVIPSTYTPIGQSSLDFPKADVPLFMKYLPALKVRGIRLYHDQENDTVCLEAVHSLPPKIEFPLVTENRVYQIHYWVTRITTSLGSNGTLIFTEIIDWLRVRQDKDSVTDMRVQYGAVDVAGSEFGDMGGVGSIFVTGDESGGTKVPVSDGLMYRLFSGAKTGQKWRQWHNQTLYTQDTERPTYWVN